MTRDEAIERANTAWRSGATSGGTYGESVVDVLAALDLLKLDEPKSAWEKFNQIARDWIDRESMGEFFTDIERAGLKITEK